MSMDDVGPQSKAETETVAAAAGAYLDSAMLSNLRSLISAQPALQAAGGDLLHYTVIIDANFVVSDLLRKHKRPELGRTAVEELVESSVLDVYAPRWLDLEMTESTIPQVAKAQDIPEDELQARWLEYREQLVWDDSVGGPEEFDDSSNADDMPYVALQDAISAAGILTKDKGVSKIGGNVLTLAFVLTVRTYARASVYSVGIRVGGTLVGWISVSALIEGVRGMASLVSRMPPWAKAGCLVGLLVVALHPELRVRVLSLLEKAYDAAKPVWPEVMRLMVLMQEKQEEADQARLEAELLVRT